MLQSVSYPVFIYKQATAPELIAGSIWYKTDTKEYFSCDGIAWTEMTQDSLLDPMIENSLDILAIQAAETLTGGQSANMVRDIFTDSTGYLNTIDAGNTTATFNTNLYNNYEKAYSGTSAAENATMSVTYVIEKTINISAPYPFITTMGNQIKRTDDLGTAYCKMTLTYDDDTTADTDEQTAAINGYQSKTYTNPNLTKKVKKVEVKVKSSHADRNAYDKLTAISGTITSDYLVQTNMETLSSTPSKFQVYAYKPTLTGTGAIDCDVSFDNGAHYQAIGLDTSADITDTGTQLILKINLNEGASAGHSSAKGFGVLFW